MGASNTKSRIELLSPAGDFEGLRNAVNFGADAVYLGGEFGMRSGFAKGREEFSGDKLKPAVDFAHQRGVRVYITANIIPTNDDVRAFPLFLNNAVSAGVDAIIVTDLGIFDIVRDKAPGLEVHISTQAGVMNYAAAAAFYGMGAKRAVLARELSLGEIADICREKPTGLEIEVFCHGAMCMGFSGRCLISKHMHGRDANRGECAQPCRREYDFSDGFAVKCDSGGTYFFNSRDMCLISHIKGLIGAGVTSLKIEGRAKGAYYTAAVTNAYRAAIDAVLAREDIPAWALSEVENVSHRPYSSGFLFGQPGEAVESGQYLQGRIVAAVVTDEIHEDTLVSQRNKFSLTDEFDVLEPGKGIPPRKIAISGIFHRTCGGEIHEVDKANKAAEDYLIRTGEKLPKGSIIRIMGEK